MLSSNPASLPELPRTDALLAPGSRTDRPRCRLTIRVSLAPVAPLAEPNRAEPIAPAAPEPQPSSAKKPASPVSARPARRRRRKLSLIAVFGVLGLINLVGLPYFLLSDAERLRSPLHDWFKPSGFIGQSAGVVAFLLFMFLWVYPLRKKYAWLGFTGSIGNWLNVHVVMGVATPLLAALHASWRFGGLIGLGYAALFIVALSGVVGRYLYVRIPRARTGIELTIEELKAERRSLLDRIESDSGLDVGTLEDPVTAEMDPQSPLSPGKTILRLLANDVHRFKATRRLKRRLKQVGPGERRVNRAAIAHVLRLARRQLALTQQAQLLGSTHRVFCYWHAAHQPIALIALLALIIHVVACISLGVTWF